MAEDKRAVQKDRDRLERIVKSTAESSNLSSSAPVHILRSSAHCVFCASVLNASA